MNYIPTGFSGQSNPQPTLKPCPICKGKIELSGRPIFGYTYYQFLCTECNMGFTKMEWQLGEYTKQEIIEEWNRREE